MALPVSLRKPLQRIAMAAASCAVLVCLSVWLVDRPFATWSHMHLGDRQFDWFTANYGGHPLPIGPFALMAGPAQVLGGLAMLMLLILAVSAAAGVRQGMRGRIVLTLSLTVLAAAEINGFAKSCFGRTWPESWLGDNPSWIRDGVFGFFPMHGGVEFGSFPSGHTTIITAPAVILWMVWPELRILWGGVVAVVAAGLLGGNYHFVSDIIGGLYLGVTIGLAMGVLILVPGDRLNWAILWNSARPTARTNSARRSRRDQDA